MVGEDDDVCLDCGDDARGSIIGLFLAEAEILDCMHNNSSIKAYPRSHPYLSPPTSPENVANGGLVNKFPG